ncbi:MAG: Riboflavin biosynthesis protein RibD [Candidatus Hydrogenedentes bacterium ADurb.Bin101]|nr:MAG: Riboflavin biosynthesis protein RibD [Candidatus Hydrogenedentes bacterium ADurb.Bin101]HOH30166.1 bifunctional diaminohydroxyphosphoribosylaminopyrimidine deaminase/5-amino-6-(5-phosphoribosylamino)uracil reductase RibD [Candidatus Hydrogenedentota bacterium]
MQSDATYMARALALAARGTGWTSPNPMVGCVIVKQDVIVGEGWHQRAGGPHAEVNAYAACGAADTFGATVYVTLEPCAHEGRTPPCVDLLLTRRPGRVVVAMGDPNPHVAGGGIERLRAAGIRVDVGVLEAEARRFNEVFVKHITTGLPWVTAKCAMTLDGKIATRTGHSKWVTGEAARAMTHRMRHAHDAILVGSRTIMLDNPSLTTRIPGEPGRHPVRIILDAGNYLSEDRAVFAADRQGPTWVATSEQTAYPFADDTLLLPPGPEGVDMRSLVRELGGRGITSLLIEGGGATLAAAFEAGIVDKVCFFCAPKLIGGDEAITPVQGRGREVMDAAIRLRDLRAIPVGEDVLLEAYVCTTTETETADA